VVVGATVVEVEVVEVEDVVVGATVVEVEVVEVEDVVVGATVVEVDVVEVDVVEVDVVVAGATVVDVDVVEVDVVVVGVHTGAVTVFESSVVAPFRASNRPCTAALVLAVIEVRARMVPTNVEPTPRVAELPTCQKTLQAWAPLMSTTRLFGAVMSVEPAWNMNTALGSPWASRVRVPVMANDDGDL
jgi:hypothetical protein